MREGRGRTGSVQLMAEPGAVIILPSIVNDVCDYFYEEEDLLEAIEKFLGEVKDDFEPFFEEKADGGEPEFDLRFSEHFEEYKKIVEGAITAFVEERGYTLNTFYNELAAKVGDRSDISTGTNVATAISSITTFEAFMSMMEDFVVNEMNPIICPPLLDGETNELVFS